MRNIGDSELTLRLLLPESLAQDTQIQNCIDAIDPELRAAANYVDFPTLYTRIDALTGNQLDHMAAGWDVWTWDDSWAVERKRIAIKTALFEKMKRGTLYAVKKAMDRVINSTNIHEWWQETPQGIPHTFTIVLDFGTLAEVLSQQDMDQLLYFVDYSKPVRSHYTFIVRNSCLGNIYYTSAGYGRGMIYARIRDCTQDQGPALGGGLYLAGAVRSVVYSRIRKQNILEFNISTPLYMGAWLRQDTTTRLTLQEA